MLIHFLSPSSYLSQKLQLALTQLRANSNIPLPLATERRQISSLPSPVEDTGETVQAEQADPYLDGQTQREEPSIDESAEVKIARAYEAIAAERVARQESKPISARELALRAKVRRSTCSEWLQQQEEHHPLGDESQDEGK